MRDRYQQQGFFLISFVRSFARYLLVHIIGRQESRVRIKQQQKSNNYCVREWIWLRANGRERENEMEREGEGTYLWIFIDDLFFFLFEMINNSFGSTLRLHVCVEAIVFNFLR